MNTIRHRLGRLVGMWVLLALLVSSAHAQASESRGPGDASGLRPRSDNVNAPSATFTVNSTADAVDAAPGNGVCATATNACTLRAAIQEANALTGDDTITLPAGTYTLTIVGANEDAAATGDLDLTSNITLNGTGAATTIIDGNWADRVLHVTGAFAVNISGVTITHGNGSGGGIRNDDGALDITNSAVSDNNSGADAGGIFSSGTLAIINSAVSDNNARTDAGGILSSGALTITNSTFSSNNAGSDGGAIFSSGTLIVTASTFSGNNAGSGGGIHDGGGAITITHSTFSENTASTGGGILTQFAATIANSTFSDNSASSGDDIYTNSGTLVVANSTIFGYVADPDRVADAVNGPADTGGGVNNSGGTVTLRNTIVAGHESGGNCVGVIANGGNNLEDGATCGWGSANGSKSNTDPLLGTLTGSPAYFPLNAGSPATDAGNNAVCAAAPVNNTSQNGVTRPADGDGNGTPTCDIGAYERHGVSKLYLPYVMK